MTAQEAPDKITLDKIDVLRERANVTYRQAYDALLAADGDVVQALIRLEEQPRSWTERFQVSGAELVGKVRDLIREGNVNRITIKHRNRTILDIPVTVGAIGAVLMPYLAAVGVIAALATRCTIEVERRPRTPGEVATGAGAAGAAGEAAAVARGDIARTDLPGGTLRAGDGDPGADPVTPGAGGSRERRLRRPSRRA